MKLLKKFIQLLCLFTCCGGKKPAPPQTELQVPHLCCIYSVVLILSLSNKILSL